MATQVIAQGPDYITVTRTTEAVLAPPYGKADWLLAYADAFPGGLIQVASHDPAWVRTHPPAHYQYGRTDRTYGWRLSCRGGQTPGWILENSGKHMDAKIRRTLQNALSGPRTRVTRFDYAWDLIGVKGGTEGLTERLKRVWGEDRPVNIGEIRSLEGTTLYIGKRGNSYLTRIYDKEVVAPSGEVVQVVRVEVELRQGVANRTARGYFLEDPAPPTGQLFTACPGLLDTDAGQAIVQAGTGAPSLGMDEVKEPRLAYFRRVIRPFLLNWYEDEPREAIENVEAVIQTMLELDGGDQGLPWD